VPLGLAWCVRTSDLLGTQGQDEIQGLHSNFMDHGVDDLARTLDYVDDGEQDLAVGFTELL
jgi:hypothetical protein